MQDFPSEGGCCLFTSCPEAYAKDAVGFLPVFAGQSFVCVASIDAVVARSPSCLLVLFLSGCSSLSVALFF